MTRTFLVALIATCLAFPAFADRIDIDDDGWSRVEESASPGFAVDIDDDGWTRVETTRIRTDDTGFRRGGDCTQLERSAGLSGEACGVLGRAELVRRIGDD
ncbi:MAG: hypothetical protein WBA25_07255 [Jannaschia sp.]